MKKKTFGHAAVAGSGVAGLVAARILSDFFDQVTIFEKDEVPSTPAFRRGVPQGHHFHGLIPGGLRILTELLPGIDGDLRAAGSLLPAPDQLYYFLPEGKSYRQRYTPEPPPDSGERPLYVQTRPMLEHCVRARVEAIPNVKTRYGAGIQDVVTQDGVVTGVVVEGAPGDPVAVDLLIDAMGQRGKTLQWMEPMGFARPAEEIIHCDFAYTTVFVRPRDPGAFRDVGLLVLPNPQSEHPGRGGGLIRVEGGLWMVAAGGRYGDFPPRDFDGLMAFLATLHHPALHELARGTEPVGSPAHFRFPKSVRRRFDRLDAFPERLLPIGDAICFYNPLYGQGMTAACRQAKGLQTALAAAADGGEGLTGLWRRFFPEAYQETRTPWLFAAFADFRDPRCTGDFPVDDVHIPPLLYTLSAAAAKGDTEARRTLESIETMETRLDILERPPWRERLAAGA